mmetsp:Transcript_1972/g.4870  ORF Transcript_1972/g.4870 Transcript_1972/m.4870 type:complete len:268 (+) Transcript_1972:588-1391(+)
MAAQHHGSLLRTLRDDAHQRARLCSIGEHHVHARLQRRQDLLAVALHHADVSRAHGHGGARCLGRGDGVRDTSGRAGHLPQVALYHEQPRAAHGRHCRRVCRQVVLGARVAEEGALRVAGGQHNHGAGRAVRLRRGQEVHAGLADLSAVKFAQRVGADGATQRDLQRLRAEELRLRAAQPGQRDEAVGKATARADLVGAAIQVGDDLAALVDADYLAPAARDAGGGQKVIAHGGVKVDDGLPDPQLRSVASTAAVSHRNDAGRSCRK